MSTSIQDLIKQAKSSKAKLDYIQAKESLIQFFEREVAKKPSLFSDYLNLRAQLPKNYRPLLRQEDINEEALDAFYKKLRQNLWTLIPEKLHPKPRAAKDFSLYQANPEDEVLQKLIAPFVSKDPYQQSMLGVNFDDKGIAATDAHKLLFLPKVKKGPKGLWCMTKKCWDKAWDMDEQGKLSNKYPPYTQIIPEDFPNSIVIEVQELRQLIHSLDYIGYRGSSFSSNKKSFPLFLRHTQNPEQDLALSTLDLFQPILQALLRLGHPQARIHFTDNRSVICLSAPQLNSNQIHQLKHEFIAFMPMAIEPAHYQKGDLIYDLNTRKLSFRKIAKAIEIGPKDTPSNTNQKRIALQAFKQKQRLIILKLQQQARAS